MKKKKGTPDIKPENLKNGQGPVYEWLKNVKFKRVRFGGVDEADVWKKIAELNGLYEKMIIAGFDKDDIAQTGSESGENVDE